MRMEWPWVRRRSFDRLRTENHVLRDALREASAELHKHRHLLARLRSGDAEVTAAVQRVFERNPHAR